jgi:hypothetical protein
VSGEVLPLVIIVALSYALKRIGLLTADDGGAMLRVVFHLGIPPLIFLSILRVDLDASLARLCLLGPIMIGLSLLVVLVVRRSVLSRVSAETFGPFLAGVVIMNTGFLLPFVERVAGPDGIARLAIIDTFVGITTFSVVYATVVRVAHGRPNPRFVLRKLVMSPPLWGLAAAVIVKLTDVSPPQLLTDTAETAARIVGTAILIALGLTFELRVERPRLVLLAVGLRFGLGAAFGAAFVALTGLDGLDANVAMFASIAPIGFNSITFAQLERLDVRFAASQVSIGLLVAMVAAPLTVRLLH